MTTESLRLIMSEVSARKMDMQMQPELSLGPTWPALGFASKSSSSSESDGSSRKKRKHYTWEWEEPVSHSHLELHLGDPLPLDWEQCLDLQSGRMYYLNRKTLKRSWNRPKEQDVNLDLNMSTTPTTMNVVVRAAAPDIISQAAGTNNRGSSSVVSGSGGGGNMIAVPCANCHLLVMLCKSSPSCPNCKFVQSLAPPPAAAANRSRIDAAVKPLQTLSLLH